MLSSIKWIVAIGAGVAGGWAARSLGDSPQKTGVKLLEVAITAKERIGRWAAVEGERLEDMVAEARSRTEPDVAKPKKRKNGGTAPKSSDVVVNIAARKAKKEAQSGPQTTDQEH